MEPMGDSGRPTRVRLRLVAVGWLCVPALAACGSDTASATWQLAPDQQLSGSSTDFRVLVTRVGCNSGVTGEVVVPAIEISKSDVVMTFEVQPGEPDSATCPGNDAVAYDVELDEPLGDRSLVDGACAGGDAANTVECDDPTRWSPP